MLKPQVDLLISTGSLKKGQHFLTSLCWTLLTLLASRLCWNHHHGRMARGGHVLPKISIGPAMPNPFTSCGRATPKTASRPFQGWPAPKAGGQRPCTTSLDTPRRTPIMTTDDAPLAMSPIWCLYERRDLARLLP
jgi:hypothetical protein